MPHEHNHAEMKDVAGITCAGVLHALSAYADGEVDRALAAQIEAHVAGCHWCEQFGGGFAQLLQTMRSRMPQATPLPADVAARLNDAIAHFPTSGQ